MSIRRWPNLSTAASHSTPYRRMNWQLKLVLMNLAVAAALFYRWRLGAPVVPLVIAGLVMFLLVNVLILLTKKKPSAKR